MERKGKEKGEIEEEKLKRKKGERREEKAEGEAQGVPCGSPRALMPFALHRPVTVAGQHCPGLIWDTLELLDLRSPRSSAVLLSALLCKHLAVADK